ncbi:MAG TPA: hypothetical protein VIV60_06660 [Polyangiaceae bacterium]
MVEAYQMLRQFRTQLREIHLSEVTFDSRHARISIASRVAYQSVAALIPNDVPIVIESVLADATEMDGELRAANRALSATDRDVYIDRCCQFVAAE